MTRKYRLSEYPPCNNEESYRRLRAYLPMQVGVSPVNVPDLLLIDSSREVE